MLDPEIPQDAQDMIQRHLATMDHVEVLMVLRGSREKSFAARDLANSIRKPDALVEACIDALAAAGLVAQLSDGSYRYSPRDEALDGAAESVIRLYNERPVTLVRMLYDRPTAVATFADAFKLRKEK